MKKKSSAPIVSGHTKFMTPLVWIILMLITYFAFQPAFRNQLTNYDERAYVTENPGIRSFSTEMIQHEFSSFYMGNYHPLTMISYALDYKLFGLNPKGYIGTNIFWHLLACTFVFLILAEISGNAAASLAGALLFSIHPTRVESVVWIAERKDVLYTAFLSIAFYLSLIWIKNGNRKYWAGTLIFFILACFSKGMAVIFTPILILTWLAWRYKEKGVLQWKALISKEQLISFLPFLVLSLIFGIVAVKAQASAEAIRTDTGVLPLGALLLYPMYGLWFYLQKLVLPIHLSAHYGYPSPYSSELFIALGMLFLVFGLVWYFRKKAPEWMYAVLFYIFSISIVLQLLPVGKAIAADRYFYFASIGFSIAICLSLSRIPRSIVHWGVAGLIGSIGFTLTQSRTQVWKDSVTLWSDTAKENPTVPFVLFNWGVSLEKTGKENDLKAIELFQRALKADSNYFEPYNNLGILLNQYGRTDEAIPLYRKAEKLKPGHSDTYNNLATALQAQGKYEEALEYFNKSMQLDPNNASPHNNLGTLLNSMGRFDEAMIHFKKAAELNATEPRVWYNLGNLFFQKNMADSAEVYYHKALSLKPDYPDAMGNLGVVYFGRKDYKTAMSWYEKAIQADPDFRDAHFNIGVAWYYMNDPEKSRAGFTRAAQLGHPGAIQWLQTHK